AIAQLWSYTQFAIVNFEWAQSTVWSRRATPSTRLCAPSPQRTTCSRRAFIAVRVGPRTGRRRQAAIEHGVAHQRAIGTQAQQHLVRCTLCDLSPSHATFPSEEFPA